MIKKNFIYIFIIGSFLSSILNAKNILTNIVFNNKVTSVEQMKFAVKPGFIKLFNDTFNDFEKILVDELNNWSINIQETDKTTYDNLTLLFKEYNATDPKPLFYTKKKDETSFCYAKRLIVPNSIFLRSSGDDHGSIYHLINNLRYLLSKKIINKKLKITKNNILAFTGDFLDRGSADVEVLYLLMRLFINNPDKVILIRGNHESFDMTGVNGFLNNLNKVNNMPKQSDKLVSYVKIINCLKLLPVTAFIISQNKDNTVDKIVQLVHGCPDTQINYNDFLSNLDINKSNYFSLYNTLKRDSSNVFLWADIIDEKFDIDEKHTTSCSASAVYNYCIKNNINLVLAGHTHVHPEYNQFGIYRLEFPNKSQIVRHIQNFGPDAQNGDYSGYFDYKNKNISNKLFYQPSLVPTKFSKLEPLDISYKNELSEKKSSDSLEPSSTEDMDSELNGEESDEKTSSTFED